MAREDSYREGKGRLGDGKGSTIATKATFEEMLKQGDFRGQKIRPEKEKKKHSEKSFVKKKGCREENKT